MNKFTLLNTATTSDLGQADKALLVELIIRADENGECFPSVERLCKARGIKHTKNFLGVEKYLPGLVSVTKRGRRNVYQLNTPAIEALSEFETVYSNTPATEGLNTPAPAEDTPAPAEDTPAAEGSNSTYNNTSNTKEDSTTVANAPVVDLDSLPIGETKENAESLSPSSPINNTGEAGSPNSTKGEVHGTCGNIGRTPYGLERFATGIERRKPRNKPEQTSDEEMQRRADEIFARLEKQAQSVEQEDVW